MTVTEFEYAEVLVAWWVIDTWGRVKDIFATLEEALPYAAEVQDFQTTAIL